jgi:hypothetical protein
MWVITQYGFVAVVRSVDGVRVGALDRLSLESLEDRASGDIQPGMPYDVFSGRYPYVVEVPLDGFHEWLDHELPAVDVGGALLLYRGEAYEQVIQNMWGAAQPIRALDQDL